MAAREVRETLPQPDCNFGGFVMSRQVDVILQQIECLDEADRRLLGERLQGLEEAEWQHEAEQARGVARQRGIDQQTVDNAVENLRYGS